MIEQDYSPEQVSGILKNNGGTTISHELIYQLIWKDKHQKGAPQWHKMLPIWLSMLNTSNTTKNKMNTPVPLGKNSSPINAGTTKQVAKQ
jgi:IS30 family transposase